MAGLRGLSPIQKEQAFFYMINTLGLILLMENPSSYLHQFGGTLMILAAIIRLQSHAITYIFRYLIKFKMSPGLLPFVLFEVLGRALPSISIFWLIILVVSTAFIEIILTSIGY